MFSAKLFHPHLGCSKSDEDDNSFYEELDEKVKYVIVEVFRWYAGFFPESKDSQR